MISKLLSIKFNSTHRAQESETKANINCFQQLVKIYSDFSFSFGFRFCLSTSTSITIGIIFGML